MSQIRTWQGPARACSVSLPVGMWEALRAKARDEDRPISWVARRAVEAYLLPAKETQDERNQNGK